MEEIDSTEARRPTGSGRTKDTDRAVREVIDPWMNLCDGTSDEDDELDDGEASE